MPSIKEFDKNQKKPKTSQAEELHAAHTENVQKRRPGREKPVETTTAEATVETQSHTEEIPMTEVEIPKEMTEDSIKASTQHEQPKVEIHFYGSEMIRAKFPKPFEVAEQIATDWKNDGDFEGVRVGHPLAQLVVTEGLKKAKELEGKILNSPTTEKLAMKALEAGLKAQENLQKIKDQFKSVTGKK